VAENIMRKNVQTVKAVSSIESIKTLLDTTNHHAFPVINSKENVIGMIPRNFILVLIKNSSYYGKGNIK